MRLHALCATRLAPAAVAHARNMKFDKGSLGWLDRYQWAHMITLIAIFVGLGHSVLAMSGEESLAQVYREIEHPKLPEFEEGWVDYFHLQPCLHFLGFLFCGDDHSGQRSPCIHGEFNRRTFDASSREFSCRGWLSTYSWWLLAR